MRLNLGAVRASCTEISAEEVVLDKKVAIWFGVGELLSRKLLGDVRRDLQRCRTVQPTNAMSLTMFQTEPRCVPFCTAKFAESDEVQWNPNKINENQRILTESKGNQWNQVASVDTKRSALQEIR